MKGTCDTTAVAAIGDFSPLNRRSRNLEMRDNKES
jgi:hypothetical protein